MTDQDIAVKLENHEQRLLNCESRLSELQAESKTMMDLTVCVNKLATNMESMLEEQKEQGSRLKKLEDAPADNWISAKKTVITALISTVVGAGVTALIMLMSQFI